MASCTTSLPPGPQVPLGGDFAPKSSSDCSFSVPGLAPPWPHAPPRSCGPRMLGSGQRCPAHLLLAVWLTESVPHSHCVPQTGFHCCGRVTALVGSWEPLCLGVAWWGIRQSLCPVSVQAFVLSSPLGLLWRTEATLTPSGETCLEGSGCSPRSVGPWPSLGLCWNILQGGPALSGGALLWVGDHPGVTVMPDER